MHAKVGKTAKSGLKMVGKTAFLDTKMVGKTILFMIKRNIYNNLTNFYKEEKKALLITGARQVGKTFAIRKTGKECFEHFIELNFVEQPQLRYRRRHCVVIWQY